MTVNRLPFAGGSDEWDISHGNFDDPGHGDDRHGRGQPFAWDISYLGGAREIHAARAGWVIDVRKHTPPSIRADPSNIDIMLGTDNEPRWQEGNYVVVRHVDGTTFTYAHFANKYPFTQPVRVSVGDYVFQGQVLGDAGDTGRAHGVHLHIEAHTWMRINQLGLGGDQNYGWDLGSSLIVHFSGAYHSTPWRPLAHDNLLPHTPFSRQDGWRRCVKCSGLFFQKPALYGNYIAEHGVCPAGGGHVHSSWFMYSLTNDPNFGGKGGWFFCRKCRVLFKDRSDNVCPLFWPTPGHDPTGSSEYFVEGNLYGQHGWRECRKCRGLYHLYEPSTCPRDGLHHEVQPGSDNNYTVQLGREDSQQRWKYCRKCHVLFYSSDGLPAGRCPADDGLHTPAASSYTLSMNVSPINADTPKQAAAPPKSRGWQGGWKFCNLCNGLYFGPNVNKSWCRGAQLLGQGSMLTRRSPRHYSASGRNYNLLIWHSDRPQDATLFGEPLKDPSDGQRNWFWCHKCQGLWYPAGSGSSRCPKDNTIHSRTGSGDYLLFRDVPPVLPVADSDMPGPKVRIVPRVLTGPFPRP